jgi:hypothetical protein
MKPSVRCEVSPKRGAICQKSRWKPFQRLFLSGRRRWQQSLNQMVCGIAGSAFHPSRSSSKVRNRVAIVFPAPPASHTNPRLSERVRVTCLFHFNPLFKNEIDISDTVCSIVSWVKPRRLSIRMSYMRAFTRRGACRTGCGEPLSTASSGLLCRPPYSLTDHSRRWSTKFEFVEGLANRSYRSSDNFNNTRT